MTWDIVRMGSLAKPRLIALLSGYFLLTPLNAASDGLAWLLLVNVFSARVGLAVAGTGAVQWITRLAPARLAASESFPIMLVSALFLLRAALTMVIMSLEGAAQATIRRALQEHAVAVVMRGRWDFLRRGNVGQWTGAATEESALFSNYMIMAARSAYALVSFALLAGMAVWVNPKLSLLMFSVALPMGLILRLLYKGQAAAAARMAAARQRFAADANERLTGLFQIKAFGDLSPHISAAVAGQDECTRAEITVADFAGLINASTPLFLPILLVAFTLWTAWHHQNASDQLHVLGSVGILGYRAVTQLGTLVGSLGNLTAYSGCLGPVLRLCRIPPQAEHPQVPEPIKGIELSEVGYSYGEKRVVHGATASVSAGKVFLLTGESGGGKTTLANLVSGLHEPDVGAVEYVGTSGNRYDTRRWRARIGYVTQDVFLFRGSVRGNLDPWGKLPEAELWRCLEQAGAASFVRAIGGLDAEVSEAGRSLSGGERRRLAIAATLAQRADALVLDEVTNGLDEAAKAALVETIAELARETLVIAISHDHAAFAKIETARYNVSAASGQSRSESR